MSATNCTDAQQWPFIVWEGTRGGSASGRSYRFRWRAVLAAWWWSRYAGQDVWIERRHMPISNGGGDRG